MIVEGELLDVSRHLIWDVAGQKVKIPHLPTPHFWVLALILTVGSGTPPPFAWEKLAIQMMLQELYHTFSVPAVCGCFCLYTVYCVVVQ